VLTDFMPVETLSAWQFRELNNNTWRREDGSCHCLVRMAECTHGEVAITMTLKVSPEYAVSPSEISVMPDGLGAVISGGQQHVGLGVVGAYRVPSFRMEVVPDPEGMHASIIVQATLQEGERLVFALGVGRNAQAARRLAERELHERNFDWELAHTLHCWRTWAEGSRYRGPYAERVERSALVLKLLIFAPSGASVAAPTTSLPEEIGGERNWDYRFCWTRDSHFAIDALLELGSHEDAKCLLWWFMQATALTEPRLHPLYRLDGGIHIIERVLPLAGYRQSRPGRTRFVIEPAVQHPTVVAALVPSHRLLLLENGDPSAG